jgi:hypothetical protein
MGKAISSWLMFPSLIHEASYKDFSLFFFRRLYNMKVWPRISIRVENVCRAIFDATFLASSFLRALFNILTFTISLLSSCLEISFMILGAAPSFPTHMVGFSALSSRFIRRFILGVNIFSPFFQWDARVFATFETGDNHMGLPSRLDADTTVHTGENKAFTVSANESPIFSG